MNKESFKKAGVRWGTIFGIFFVVLLLSTQMIPTPQLKPEPSWHIVWEGSLAEATEATLTAGASQFLEIFFINHSVIPWDAYDNNLSYIYETWCNASLDADGAAGTTNHAYAIADNFNLTVKWGTTFDVVCRVRFNKTHAWDGAKFLNSSCRVNITMAGGGVTILGTTSGNNIETRNDTSDDFIWINVYWDGVAHAGYTLNKNGISLVSQISIQAKY